MVSATSSPHYTVDWAEFSRLAKAPRYLIDLAVPRDIDPACGEKAALYDIDTLGREEFTRERALLLQQARQIVDRLCSSENISQTTYFARRRVAFSAIRQKKVAAL